MLDKIEGNGTRSILVETASRFARDLMVQEVGFAMLQARGIELIAADNPTSFLDDTPTARLIRQVLLARKRPKGGKRSLRDISDELQAAGFVTKSGKPFEATAVKRMLA